MFALLADLVRYGAWTVHLPEILGRLIGWSAMLCAPALVMPRFRLWSALALLGNQLVAASVHFAQGETGALPQNVVLVALLAAIAFASRTKFPTVDP